MYDQKDVQVNVTSVETPQDFCKINTEMKKKTKQKIPVQSVRSASESVVNFASLSVDVNVE